MRVEIREKPYSITKKGEVEIETNLGEPKYL
jgi:hypothetical protein